MPTSIDSTSTRSSIDFRYFASSTLKITFTALLTIAASLHFALMVLQVSIFFSYLPERNDFHIITFTGFLLGLILCAICDSYFVKYKIILWLYPLCWIGPCIGAIYGNSAISDSWVGDTLLVLMLPIVMLLPLIIAFVFDQSKIIFSTIKVDTFLFVYVWSKYIIITVCDVFVVSGGEVTIISALSAIIVLCILISLWSIGCTGIVQHRKIYFQMVCICITYFYYVLTNWLRRNICRKDDIDYTSWFTASMRFYSERALYIMCVALASSTFGVSQLAQAYIWRRQESFIEYKWIFHTLQETGPFKIFFNCIIITAPVCHFIVLPILKRFNKFTQDLDRIALAFVLLGISILINIVIQSRIEDHYKSLPTSGYMQLRFINCLNTTSQIVSKTFTLNIAPHGMATAAALTNQENFRYFEVHNKEYNIHQKTEDFGYERKSVCFIIYAQGIKKMGEDPIISYEDQMTVNSSQFLHASVYLIDTIGKLNISLKHNQTEKSIVKPMKSSKLQPGKYSVEIKTDDKSGFITNTREMDFQKSGIYAILTYADNNTLKVEKLTVIEPETTELCYYQIASTIVSTSATSIYEIAYLRFIYSQTPTVIRGSIVGLSYFLSYNLLIVFGIIYIISNMIQLSMSFLTISIFCLWHLIFTIVYIYVAKKYVPYNIKEI